MWAQISNTVLGIWLIAAPGVLGYSGIASVNDRIVGPWVAAIAYIAVWEVNRGLRYLNMVFGIWLMIAGWILDYPVPAAMNVVIIGVLIVSFSCVEGKRRHQYAGGWASLWRK